MSFDHNLYQSQGGTHMVCGTDSEGFTLGLIEELNAMASKISILSPAAEAWRPIEATVPHIDDLRGTSVALLNNHWTSMNIIAEQIAILLKEQYGVAEVFELDIPLASRAAQETFDEVRRRAQLAVVGLAN